jgi:hypothetical protein
MNRRIAILAASAVLAGCAGMYYAPRGAATASLRVTNQSLLGPLGAAVYDGPNCPGGKALAAENVGKGRSAEYAVDAGMPLTVVFDGDRGSAVRLANGSVSSADIRRCQAPVVLTLQAGGKYEAVYSDDGRACSVEVFDLGSGARQPYPHQKVVRGGTVIADRKECGR